MVVGLAMLSKKKVVMYVRIRSRAGLCLASHVAVVKAAPRENDAEAHTIRGLCMFIYLCVDFEFRFVRSRQADRYKQTGWTRAAAGGRCVDDDDGERLHTHTHLFSGELWLFFG